MNQFDLFAPPTNSAISDLALDLGEWKLDEELEETRHAQQERMKEQYASNVRSIPE